MNLSSHQNTFRIIGASAVVLLLLGLGGWYLFLSHTTSTIESVGESRGFSVGIPSFSGTRGSAIENLVQGLTPDTTLSSPPSGDVSVPRLWQINTTPVAGAGFIVQGSSTIVRFVERSSGHVFDADLETGAVVRRTNTSIGTVYEALIAPNDTFLLRTLNDDGDAETLVAQFGTTTDDTLSELETTTVGPTNALAFRGETPLFLIADEGSALVAASPESDEILFSSPIEQWRIVRADPLIVAERAASGVFGSAFAVDREGTPQKIASGEGLTISAHPKSNAFLIGEAGNTLRIFAQSTASATRTTLPIVTIADKCAWAPGNSLTAYCAVPQGEIPPRFLDAWYRGSIHTEDHWFVVESGAGTAERLFAPGGDTALDVEHPMIDESARYIVFMNARDKSLWALRIYE